MKKIGSNRLRTSTDRAIAAANGIPTSAAIRKPVSARDMVTLPW